MRSICNLLGDAFGSQRAGHCRKAFVGLLAQASDTADDHGTYQGGEKTVFNGGRAVFVLAEGTDGSADDFTCKCNVVSLIRLKRLGVTGMTVDMAAPAGDLYPPLGLAGGGPTHDAGLSYQRMMGDGPTCVLHWAQMWRKQGRSA